MLHKRHVEVQEAIVSKLQTHGMHTLILDKIKMLIYNRVKIDPNAARDTRIDNAVAITVLLA